jgi:hypothetical protein
VSAEALVAGARTLHVKRCPSFRYHSNGSGSGGNAFWTERSCENTKESSKMSWVRKPTNTFSFLLASTVALLSIPWSAPRAQVPEIGEEVIFIEGTAPFSENDPAWVQYKLEYWAWQETELKPYLAQLNEAIDFNRQHDYDAARRRSEAMDRASNLVWTTGLIAGAIQEIGCRAWKPCGALYQAAKRADAQRGANAEADRILHDPMATAEQRRRAMQQKVEMMGQPPGPGGFGGGRFAGGRPSATGSGSTPPSTDSRIGTLGNSAGNVEDGLDALEDLTDFLEDEDELLGGVTLVDAHPLGSPISDIHDPRWAAAVAHNPRVFDEYNLTPDTIVYRVARGKYLDVDNNLAFGNSRSMAGIAVPGEYEPHPFYPGAQVPREISASSLADPGLNVSLSDTARSYARGDDFILTQMRLGDMLSAGGRVYLDSGSWKQGSLYVTLPNNQPIPITVIK